MAKQTVLHITLVVKGDGERAVEAAWARLAAWFNERTATHPPFPEGCLLWYQIAAAPKEKLDVFQPNGGR